MLSNGRGVRGGGPRLSSLVFPFQGVPFVVVLGQARWCLSVRPALECCVCVLGGVRRPRKKTINGAMDGTRCVFWWSSLSGRNVVVAETALLVHWASAAGSDAAWVFFLPLRPALGQNPDVGSSAAVPWSVGPNRRDGPALSRLERQARLDYVSGCGLAEPFLPPSQPGGPTPRWSVLRLHHLRRPAPGKLRANASITSRSSILPYHHQLPTQPNVPHRSEATSRTPQNSSTENPSQCLVRCSVCTCPAALTDG